MDRRHRRTRGLDLRFGDVLLRDGRRGKREERQGKRCRSCLADAAFQDHDCRNSLVFEARPSVSMPPGPASTTADAMPMKRPCSTTPGIAWSALDSAIGSGMRPKDA